MQNGLNVEAELYQTLKNLKGGEPKIISTVLWIGTAVVDNVNPTVVHNDFVSTVTEPCWTGLIF